MAQANAVPRGCVVTPADVVREYYQLWYFREYRDMYALFSPRYRAAHPYARWLQQNGTQLEYGIDVKAESPSSDVFVRYTDDTTGRWYSGIWHLVRKNATWLLDASNIAQIAPPPASAGVRNPPTSTPVEQWLNRQPALEHGVLGNISGSFDDRFRARTSQYDCFIDPSGRSASFQPGCSNVGGSGLVFRLGPAGPVDYQVLYDPAHSIVWFERGCCSALEQTLIGGATPPPVCIGFMKPLTSIHTRRGVRLGDSIAAVAHIYGHPNPISAGNYTLLLYQFSRNTGPDPLRCEESSFAFLGGRLTAIDFSNGCA